MPRDGSGVFSFTTSDRVSGNTIVSADYNADRDELVSLANEQRPLSRGGTAASTATAARTNLAVGEKHGDGSAAAPTIGFASDADTGLYLKATGDLGFTVGGTYRLNITTTYATFTVPMVGPAGSVSAPAIILNGDVDTGFYQIGANNLGIAAAGTKVIDIDSNGVELAADLLIGVSSAMNPASGSDEGFSVDYSVPNCVISRSSQSSGPLLLRNLSTQIAGGGYFIIFYGTGPTVIGSIRGEASTTYYNTSSDERLKESPRPFDAAALIDAIEPVEFEWKTNGETGYGVIAQDVYTIFPQAVTVGSRDELKPDDEDFRPWSVDYAKFVPLLIAEIKALRKRVADLEDK